MQNKQSQTEGRNAWVFGFTPQAELWNGRLAMLGFAAIVISELVSGHSVLRSWGLI